MTTYHLMLVNKRVEDSPQMYAMLYTKTRKYAFHVYHVLQQPEDVNPWGSP